MSKFKIGDVVVRIASEHQGMKIGDKALVVIAGRYGLKLRGYEGGTHDSDNLRLATPEEADAYLAPIGHYIESSYQIY